MPVCYELADTPTSQVTRLLQHSVSGLTAAPIQEQSILSGGMSQYFHMVNCVKVTVQGNYSHTVLYIPEITQGATDGGLCVWNKTRRQ